MSKLHVRIRLTAPEPTSVVKLRGQMLEQCAGLVVCMHVYVRAGQGGESAAGTDRRG